MEAEKIERINFLAKKAKEENLSEEEKKEQQILRKAYIESWRRGMRETLNSVRIVEEDGSMTSLKKKK